MAQAPLILRKKLQKEEKLTGQAKKLPPPYLNIQTYDLCEDFVKFTEVLMGLKRW